METASSPAGRTAETPEVDVPGGEGESRAASTAFDLGWSMAKAFEIAVSGTLARTWDSDTTERALPGLGALSPRQRLEALLDEINMGTEKLHRSVPVSSVAPTLDDVRSELEDVGPGGPGMDRLVAALRRTHVDLMRWCQATDRRYGTAYLLGRSLADAARHRRREDPASIEKSFSHGRQHQRGQWLTELSSALPEYAASVVRESLMFWTGAVADACRDSRRKADRLSALNNQLNAQADLWRSILTGVLDPRNLLVEQNNAAILSRMTLTYRDLLGLTIRRLWWPVVLPVLLVVGAVVILMALTSQGSAVTRTATALVAVGGGAFAVWQSAAPATVAAFARFNRPLLDQELVAEMSRQASWPLAKAVGTRTGSARRIRTGRLRRRAERGGAVHGPGDYVPALSDGRSPLGRPDRDG